jgi:S1-C subfamily serine protease
LHNLQFWINLRFQANVTSRRNGLRTDLSPSLEKLTMLRALAHILLLFSFLQPVVMSGAFAYSLEARDFERWVILAAKDNLPDAAALSREFAERFAGVRVIRTENGWFAICIGPIPVLTTSDARKYYASQSPLPADAYVAQGSKLVEIMYRPGSAEPAASVPATANVPATPPPQPRPDAENRSAGTGFFITSKGHMLTNAHVVAGCTIVSVFHGNDAPGSGRVLAQDKTNDLAIIATNLTPDAVADLRNNIRLGEQIEAFGFPLSGLLSSGGNFTLGNVTALTGLRDDSRILQISAPVQPGNSGGPLLDDTGRVVGVVVSKLNAIKVAAITEDVPQNINFAIKASVARSFAESQGITVGTAADKAPKLAAPDIAELARSFTGRVECVH